MQLFVLLPGNRLFEVLNCDNSSCSSKYGRPRCFVVSVCKLLQDPWVKRSSIIRHTGLYIYGLCSPSHTDDTSLPLLHRDVPARTPFALPAQELRRQPMSTGPIDHFQPTSIHFDTTRYPFALPAKVLCHARIEPTTSGSLRNGCAGAATNVRSMG
jgi:hypothetical protein